MDNDEQIEVNAADAAKEFYRHKGFSGSAARIATSRYIAALEAQVSMLKRQRSTDTLAMLAN